MSSNSYSRGSNISVRLNNDGLRYVGRNAAMDREPSSSNFSNYNSRGRGGRGNSGGRWQRGGGFRGNRGGYRGRGRGRGRGHDSRANEDEDGDLVMNESQGYGSYSRGARQEGRRERSPEMSSQRTDSGWWKVTVVDGRKHNREWLIKRIKDLCRIPFRENNLRLEGNNSIFFVNDESVANALEDTSNRITTKDGSKIIIQVSSGDNAPRGNSINSSSYVTLDEEKLNQLNLCLAQRYDVATFKLDLSKLLHDPLLKNANIIGNVANPPFMNTVLDIIHSVCSNLKILDLSNNHILRLDNLAKLPEKCPELEELILSDNDIRFTGELTKISSHKKISRLWFKGNPGERQFQSNHSAYLADVRKRLPNLTSLDGVEAPPVIKFVLPAEDKSYVPDTKGAYAANTNDMDLVKVFVQNYFQFYDHVEAANDRQSLLDAYHNEAVFSLCCNSSLQNVKSNSLSTYIKSSRNLKNIKDSKHKKASLLIYKKLKIVAFLIELPSTKHILDSFTLDLTLSTPAMLCFTLQGIFLEGENEVPRGFARTFICQRESNKFSIVNELLHVRNVTENQLKFIELAKQNAPTQNSIPAPVESAEPVYSEVQQELATKFSAESKMNMKYSILCLETANWDYQLAATRFIEVNEKGGIPAEAFLPI